MADPKTLDWKEIGELNKQYSQAHPEQIVSWAVESGLRIGLASSFSAEDTALIHMLHSAIVHGAPDSVRVHVFYLETGRLHEETLQTLDECKKQFPLLAFKGYFPQRQSVEDLLNQKGAFSFYESIENRKECCFVRKVEPLNRALSELDGWITGLRQAQSPTRAQVPVFQADVDHGGILKLNPLSAWSEDELYDYIGKNHVPLNPLHNQGFPSIGCSPCTRAIKPGEDIRAGRWWWESPEHKECGLHAPGEKAGESQVLRP